MDEAKSKAENLGSRRVNTKKLATLAMLAVIAYAVMWVTRGLPNIVLVLKYDPKDVIFAIGGFIYGPLAVVAMSIVVSVAEMVTVSTTGPIGLVMNILSTCSFVCVAALIYKRRRNVSGAILGLVAGSLTMTAVMILWNYLLTPIFFGFPRQAVVEMLVPAILPFNLLKSGINSALIILLYKPVVSALRKAKLMPELATNGGIKWGVALSAGVVLATLILLVLVMMGII